MTEQVVAYERRTVSSQERIELVELELPPTTFATEAVWFSPEGYQLAELDEMPRLLGTLHAAEHALIALLPLWAMCDRWDIGGLSTNIHPQTGRPTVFVYDGHPGVSGSPSADSTSSRAGCETLRPDPRLPVLERLPLLRPEPKVRQPERHARQGRGADLSRAPCRFRRASFVVLGHRQQGRRTMQYLVLIYGNEQAWEQMTEEEGAAIYKEYMELDTTGVVGGAQLQPSTTATSVRVRNGETLTTDGPFAETKEALGGYYLFEGENLDDAIAFAARIPGARSGTVEVRPLVQA